MPWTNGQPPGAPALTGQQQQLLQGQINALNNYVSGLSSQNAVSQGLLPSLLARSGYQITPQNVAGLMAPKTGALTPQAGTDWLNQAYQTLLGRNPTADEVANLQPMLKSVTGQPAAQAAQQQILQAIAASPAGQQKGLAYGGGNLYGVKDTFGPQMQAAAQGNLGLAQQYQKAAGDALTGNLEAMNPALTQYLNTQRQQFQDQMGAKYGSPAGAALSTPAQIAQYYNDLGRTNALVGNQQTMLSNYQNLANAALSGGNAATQNPSAALGTAFGGVGGYGQAAAGFQNPLATLGQQQLLGYQSGLNAYNANSANNASLWGALGSAGMAAAPYLFGTPTAGSGALSGLGSTLGEAAKGIGNWFSGGGAGDLFI